MDTMRKQIINFWKGSLRRLPQSMLLNIPIAEFTKDFLTEVGVPQMEELSVNFITDPAQYAIIIFGGEEYLVIGDNVGVHICIKKDVDEMFLIDEEGEIPVRFINSNIELFLFFAMTYLSASSDRETISYEDAIKIARKLKEIYNSLDAKALADPNSWWSVILEQVDYGM